MSSTKRLSIYLNDHLMGSTVGVELARRARAANEGTALGALLEQMVREIEEDRDALQRVMDDLGVGRDRAKVATGWAAEKLGRLKPNGQLIGYSPLSRVVELEGLVLGITGKLLLWRTLAHLADSQPRIDRAEMERLAQRAERQRQDVETHRLAAALEAFAD